MGVGLVEAVGTVGGIVLLAVRRLRELSRHDENATRLVTSVLVEDAEDVESANSTYAGDLECELNIVTVMLVMPFLFKKAAADSGVHTRSLSCNVPDAAALLTSPYIHKRRSILPTPLKITVYVPWRLRQREFVSAA